MKKKLLTLINDLFILEKIKSNKEPSSWSADANLPAKKNDSQSVEKENPQN